MARKTSKAENEEKVVKKGATQEVKKEAKKEAKAVESKVVKAKKEVKEKPEVVQEQPVEKQAQKLIQKLEKPIEKSVEKPVEKLVEKPKIIKSVETIKAAEKKTEKKKAIKSEIVSHGVGRRKSAVARVWLLRGAGSITVNGRDYQTYFDTQQMQLDANEPFRVIPRAKNYDVKAIIVGGGKSGQASALKVGIARSLSLHDPEFRSELRKFGLLTVDSRLKERKKPGRKAARKRFQFVKR